MKKMMQKVMKQISSFVLIGALIMCSYPMQSVAADKAKKEQEAIQDENAILETEENGETSEKTKEAETDLTEETTETVEIDETKETAEEVQEIENITRFDALEVEVEPFIEIKERNYNRENKEKYYKVKIETSISVKFSGDEDALTFENKEKALEDYMAQLYRIEEKDDRTTKFLIGSMYLDMDEDENVKLSKEIHYDKVKEDGNYSWAIVIKKLGTEVTGKTTDINSMEVPDEITVNISELTFKTDEKEVTSGEICTGYEVAYKAEVKVILEGITDDVSASERRSEIEEALSSYRLEIRKGKDDGEATRIFAKTIDEEEFINTLIDANGNEAVFIVEETTAITSAGKYEFYATIGGIESEKKTITIEKKKNDMEYIAQENTFAIGEKITYSFQKGVIPEGATAYESDKNGNEIENKTLKIEKEGNDFTIEGTALGNYYVTFEQRGNSFYNSAKQTMEVTVVQAELWGSISSSNIYYKAEQLVVEITLEAANMTLLKQHAGAIQFNLKAVEKNDNTVELKTSFREIQSKEDCVIYRYTIKESSSLQLKHDAKYTIHAEADFSKMGTQIYKEPQITSAQIEVLRSSLEIEILDYQEVYYNKGDNQLSFKLKKNAQTEAELDKSNFSYTIVSENPDILSIDNEGKFQTHMGKETKITITVDDKDNDTKDIYEATSKTIVIKVLSPQNTEYTLNGKTRDEFLKTPNATVNNTEKWYRNVRLELGEDNLYSEIIYRVNGGAWTKTGRVLELTDAQPSTYEFYFSDAAANIFSWSIKDGVESGEIHKIENIGVDNTNPVLSTTITTNIQPSKYSTDTISYFSTNMELTVASPEKGIVVDGGAGIKKVSVQYQTDGEWIDIQDIKVDERYEESFTIALEEDAVYENVKIRVEDYLGNQSEAIAYGKSICIDSKTPMVTVIPYTMNQNGELSLYEGDWTNKQLKYEIIENDQSQLSGIHGYEYVFIPDGSQIEPGKVTWKQVTPEDGKWKIVFGTNSSKTQDTIEGVLSYEQTEHEPIEDNTEEYAQMNGLLYLRATSNADLKTTQADIQAQNNIVKIWQADLDVATVTADKKCDATTGWYNQKTGAVTLSFTHQEYDNAEYAPKINLVYSFETQEDEMEQAAINTLNKNNQITIDKDSINHISVYVMDEAGNVSDITTYEIKADFIAPENVTANINGEEQTIHMDNTEGIVYRNISQNDVIVSAQAEYGISSKQSFHMIQVKDQGEKGVVSSNNAVDSLTISPCSRGLIYLCAMDGAGNMTEAWTDGIVADNLAPTGENQTDITISTEGKNIAGFYNKDILVSVKVVDAPTSDNYSGLADVTYTLGTNKSDVQERVTVYDKQSTALSWNDIKSSASFSTNHIVIDAEKYEGNQAYIEITAIDHAGNKTVTKQELQIDVTKPQIAISFDNNNAVNGTYYNNNRVAKVEIQELNFDTSKVSFTIKKDGQEVVASDYVTNSWSTSGDIHTTYVTFSADGDYILTVQCTDLAGNEADTVETDAFTIDKMKPIVEVTYDNNMAYNNGYYNQTRTATITVTEHNFDTSDFEALVTPQATIGNWTHQNDVHTITIRFDQEQFYRYTIQCRDLAGNEMNPFVTEEFYIDMTAPNVQIIGVENHSANAGDVNPVITVSDANYDTAGVQITLNNSKGSQIELIKNVSGTEGSYSYALSNVNDLKDEIYTLLVVATDLSGNVTELSYQFSLNRHGSVYDLSEMAAITQKAYMNYKNMSDLQIREMNVNAVAEFSLYITRNGEVLSKVVKDQRPAVPDADTIYYATDVSGDDSIGYEYKYTIYKETFEQEGIYYIMFYSKDVAGNEINNTLTEKDAEITFIVDNTEPTVVVEGVEDGKLYTQEVKEVNVYVSDNTKVQEAYFYIVDEDSNTLQTYDYMEMVSEAGEVLTLSIPSNDKKQSIQYYVMDVAGNSISTVNNKEAIDEFMVSTNAWLRFVNNKKAVGGVVAGGTGAATLAGIDIFLKKRRKFWKIK